MPITISARKSLRVAQRRHQENLRSKLALKSALKKVSRGNLSEVYSAIDKAANRDVIHRHKAARLKSRLAKKWSALTYAIPGAKKKKLRQTKK
jgi:ribosomal protein S20